MTVWVFGRRIHALYGQIQASLAVLSAKAQENLSGVRMIRAFAQERAELRRFEELNRQYIAQNVRLVYRKTPAQPVWEDPGTLHSVSAGPPLVG